MPDDYDCCMTCLGKGGTLEHDWDGDGVWATPVVYLNYCPDCLDAAMCPGCGWAFGLVNDVADVCCERCGWVFDMDRFDEAPDEY